MTKLCKVCEKEKPLEDFQHYLSKGRKYSHSYCKLCTKDYKAKWRKSNRQAENARTREWRQNNKDRVSKYNAQWKRGNPYLTALHSGKRSERVKACTPDWLTESHIAEMNYIYSLAKELSAMSGEPYHVDHIIPVKGKDCCGLNVPWNLQVLPADLNLAKYNKLERN